MEKVTRFLVLLRKHVLILSLAWISAVASGQTLPGIASSNDANTASPADPLGRETPRGAFFGFLKAAQRDQLRTAAQYLQLPEAERDARGRRLAAELSRVLDQKFVGSIDRISDKPEGALEDSLPPNQDRAGFFEVKNDTVDILLVRVTSSDGRMIWVFSAETLRRVPQAFAEIGSPKIEEMFPPSWLEGQILGMPIWLWALSIAVLPVAFALAILVWGLVAVPLRLRHKGQTKPAIARYRGPLLMLITVLIHFILLRTLGLPLLFRLYYSRVLLIVIFTGLAWLASRGVDWAFARVWSRIKGDSTAAESVVQLGRRLVKAIVWTLFLFGVLSLFDVRFSAALAGLGIGGIAVALGAQKTLEHIIGGITIVSDQVIRVGDTCRFGDRLATVEDVSLRSTRVRTLEGTLMAIPNGVLAGMTVENLSMRKNVLLNPTFTLRYETTADQLRYILADIRRLLSEDPRIVTEGARIRFAGFNASSLNLEMFAYVSTNDFGEYTAIREDILFRIMDIVERNGSSFAFPSQVLYLSRDSKPSDQGPNSASKPRIE